MQHAIKLELLSYTAGTSNLGDDDMRYVRYRPIHTNTPNVFPFEFFKRKSN